MNESKTDLATLLSEDKKMPEALKNCTKLFFKHYLAAWITRLFEGGKL
jgi:hypothetical protein